MTIYFVEIENEGWVKIGYTAGTVEKRISQLQTGQPKKLRLIGSIPGEKDGEAGLHKEFDHLRGNGEWFEKCSELTSTISFLIDNQNPWYFCRAKRNYAAAWQKAFKLTENTDTSAYVDCALRPRSSQSADAKKSRAINMRIRNRRKTHGVDKVWEQKVVQHIANTKPAMNADAKLVIRYQEAWAA